MNTLTGTFAPIKFHIFMTKVCEAIRFLTGGGGREKLEKQSALVIQTWFAECCF